MSFHEPSAWFLLLLVLLPLAWWRRGGRRRRAVAFSSVGRAERAGVTWAVRLRWVVPALRSAAVALLIVCVARPQKVNERTRVLTEGIAIQLVVDRSGSMLAEDFRLDGRPTNRLEVVKQVVGDFIGGSGSLPGRPDDLIGLIAFGTFADSMCPLTLDHDHLERAVAEVEVPDVQTDQATAIGDALALGVERMAGIEKRRGLDGDRRIKSKIMILLTDGESNAGEIDPLTAAQMAAAFDIKVYTIGAGTDQAWAPVPVIDPFTGRTVTRRVPVSIDETTLREIARVTGGQYYRATDTDALEEVYATIDELERTKIEERRFTDYKEMAIEPVTLHGVRMPPLLSVVIVLLGLEMLLASTRFRRLP